jgi:hypothetical protein
MSYTRSSINFDNDTAKPMFTSTRMTPVILQNIERVDEIYLWFVKIKEERERLNGELK